MGGTGTLGSRAARSGVAPAVRAPRARTPTSAALVVGAIAAIITGIGSGAPSYWGDEAASVLSAGRSLPSLFGLLGEIDAVHGAYYVLLHFWIGLVGTTEFAVRLPSVIAVGIAAAGTTVLGARLVDRSTGVVAGSLFAVLPVVTRYGIEARSYAAVMAVAVWTIVLLIGLVRRRTLRARDWVWFAAVVAVGIHLFVYLVLLLPVHAAVLLALRPGVAVLRRWAVAAGCGVIASIPFLLVVVGQREQIAFLARRGYASIAAVFEGQWFGGSIVLAALLWSLLIWAVVAAVRVRRLRPAMLIALTWTLVPTLVLLVVNAVVTPVYNLRYPSFSAPGVALGAAVGIRAIRMLWARGRAPARAIPVVAVIVVAAFAAPGYLAQRGPFAKDGGADLRQTAEVVAANASPGDAVVFDSTTKPSRRPRLALDLYPERFAGLADPALVTPLAERTRLWDRVRPIDETVRELTGRQRVWVIEVGADDAELRALARAGFRLGGTYSVHRATVYEMLPP